MAQYRRFFEDAQETKVAGLYDLGPTIGKGHYAVVKLARHVFTGESVAVKVIDKTKLDQVSREHLFQEVVCMKLVQHPNVVRLYEVIDTVNKLYLVLELGDGGDLYDYIMKHENGLSEHLAKRYFRQIVTAISYCHNLHVVHRDLKPENVVFFEQLGVVKLTDFGFSNQFVPGKHLETACGSLAYSAPEILLGNSYDAPKVDIWSLGVILYMLVCGHLPFEEANDSETLTKIMDCEYQLPPHLSPACCNLISRLLIRDPAKRALLDEILQDDWLRLDGDELPIDLFSVPLVSQEHLSFEDHMEILNKMASGGLASVDEIQMALNRNEYSYISATYYLLAERKLKRNYIEEYKQLSAQAKMIEQTYMQRTSAAAAAAAVGGGLLPTSAATAPCLNSNPKPFGAGAVLPKSISASLAASGAEERLRRFSMILEDEEEDAAEQEVAAALRTNTPTLADELVVVAETSDEALMDEEQEELEAVVSLACVRSELMDQNPEVQTIAASAATATATTDLRSLGLEADHNRFVSRFASRPSSRLGTPSMAGDLYEHIDSESSLAGATAAAPGLQLHGAPLLAELRKSAASSHSLVLSRHFKRPLRPLISVKSSPQLLKYIAEEDWQAAPPGAVGTVTFETPDDDETAQPAQTPVQQNHILTVNRSLEYPPSKASNLPPLSKNAPSTLHSKAATSSAPRARSPPWGRKSQSSSVANFGSSVSSRPGSGMNWMPPPERRRRASVSSLLASPQPPNAPSSVGSTSLFFTSRHTPNSSFYFRTSSMLRNRDRRRSGPPGFSVFFLGQHLGLAAQSGLENASTNNSNNAGSPFARISVNLGSSRSSLEASDREQSVVNEVPTHRPPTFAAPSTNMAILRENPTEEGEEKKAPLQRRFRTSCQSAPSLLDNMPLTVNTSASSLPISTSPPAIAAGDFQAAPTMAVVTTINTQVCTPIREEEDENRTLSSPTNTIEGGAGSQDNHHAPFFAPVSKAVSANMAPFLSSPRRSLQPGPATTEPFVRSTLSSLRHGSSTWVSRLRNNSTRGSTGGPNAISSQLTASNFSLSSLAGSLLDSRHMMDIIRGTFELQVQSKRRSGLPRLHMVSSFDTAEQYTTANGGHLPVLSAPPTGTTPPVATSSLSMVRSLTLINSNGGLPAGQFKYTSASLRSSRHLRHFPTFMGHFRSRQSSVSPNSPGAPPPTTTAVSPLTTEEVFCLGNSDCCATCRLANDSSIGFFHPDCADGYASSDSMTVTEVGDWSKRKHQPSVYSLPSRSRLRPTSLASPATTKHRGAEVAEDRRRGSSCDTSSPPQSVCPAAPNRSVLDNSDSHQHLIGSPGRAKHSGRTAAALAMGRRLRRKKCFRLSFPCQSARVKPAAIPPAPARCGGCHGDIPSTVASVTMPAITSAQTPQHSPRRKLSCCRIS
ncbi:hypothetical protein AAHC03_010172 [Spirometra sp. Aus1]